MPTVHYLTAHAQHARVGRPLLWLGGAAFCVVGALSWLLLAPAPLHEDEAIYAAWALRLPADPLLSLIPVDKPPLVFFPLALALALLGPQAWAARLPNLGWTLLAAWAVARLVGHGRPRMAAAGAALLFLAAPLTLAHAASAFTDPAMVALVLIAAVAAQAQRPRAAGALLALATLAKPTALLLAPWALAEGGAAARAPRWWWHAGLGALAIFLGGWAWDAARYAPSWWLLGQRAYGTLGQPGAALGGWLWWLALGLGPTLLAALISNPPSSISALRSAICDLQSPLPTLLLFVPLHQLLGIQPWDRYLLPMAALLALWLGRRLARPEMAALLAVLLALPIVGWTAAEGSGLGGRDGRWGGIEALGAAVRALPPETTVLTVSLERPLAFYAHPRPIVWEESLAAARAWAGGHPGPVLLAVRRDELPPACQPSSLPPFVLIALDDPCLRLVDPATP